MTLDALRIAFVLAVAAILQVTLFASLDALGGTPDVLLVALVAVALLRGATTGAVAGFGAGLLVDAATLDTLGVSSLLLLFAGYWTGRYAETTGRDRARAPLLAVLVATVLVTLFGYVLHFLLGESVSAHRAFLEALVPSVALNLLVAVPVIALVGRAVGRGDRPERVQEVRLLG